MAHRRNQRSKYKQKNNYENKDHLESLDNIEKNLKKQTKPAKLSNNNMKVIAFSIIAIIAITGILALSNFNLVGQSSFTTDQGETLALPDNMPSRYDTTLTQEPTLSSTYEYAHQNGDFLSNFICHCGCNNPMHQPYHQSNKECFWTVDDTYEPHAENCSTCVYTALAAKSLFEANWTISNIRSFIDSQYS